MPAEFQNAMDYTLIGLKTLCYFLGDILIVSKETKEDYKQHLFNCLKRLDDKNFGLIFINASLQN